MSITLNIILTRDVTVGDLAAVATLIKRPLLDRVEGGINLANGSTDFRDLRIKHSPQINWVDYRVDYSKPESIFLAATPGVTQWLPTRLDFRVRSANAAPFALDEVMDIMGVACKQFDARPALVANRRELKVGPPLPTPADSVETVNDFYGYDVAAVVKTYTVECADFPGIEKERLFQCWRCAAMYPAQQFCPAMYNEDIPDFYWMLGNCVAGNVPACDPCCTELTVRPAAPLTATARGRTDCTTSNDSGHALSTELSTAL